MILAAILNALPTQLTPVLTYHDVIPARDAKSLWFDCTVGEFQEQIDYFERKGAKFVTIEQLRLSLSGKLKLPKNAICITFADNYQGFYKYAWPILKKKRIPVAQFVHTDFVGNTSGRPKMTWRQLTELDRSGLVTIGSQTCSHPEDLTKLSDVRLRHEMADSKRVLEQRLGHAVTSIAYPNGKYDTRVSRAARDANYLIGFTEVTQSAEKRPDIYRVPRYVHTQYKRAILENFGKS